jgi:hypothetical protein
MTSPAPAFLAPRKPRTVTVNTKGFDAPQLHLGKGNPAFEVLAVSAPAERSATQIRALWKERHGGRAVPLLLAVLHDAERVSLCGPVGLNDDPPVYAHLERAHAERVCALALDQQHKEAALRFLRDALPAIRSELPGVRNEGFFATHQLKFGAPQRPDWDELTTQGRQTFGKHDRDLLGALGFDLEPLDNSELATLLKAHGTGTRTGVAVVLTADEVPDLEAARFNGLSPVTYAMTVADREALKYVFVCQGPKVRLYPTGLGTGVGRRGRSETFVELHTGLLPDASAGYVWALLSSGALRANGTLDQLLEDSKRFAGELATKLRERIYERVVPALADALVAARKLKKPTADDLRDTYRMAMTLLFRLLFVAYAEDQDLLPYEWNGLYKQRSLKALAQEVLTVHTEKRAFDAKATTLWNAADALFRAVAEGNKVWGVPAYGGELFARNTTDDPSGIGAKLAALSFPNDAFGPILHDLLLIEAKEFVGGLGPIDFRSLGVREFGTVYEGLLESELAVAETDLATDDAGNYRPAKPKEPAVVKKGAVYLHNRSGQRKATGTYFTKEFAVDHLLDEALEPALADHLARLDALTDAARSEAFFDFRVADIAMGSAHFLVAAVDRIERALAGYLARRSLPSVRAELAVLHAAARKALGDTADLVDEEKLGDAALLRRQIARRCIYGADLNPIAVSLARLSIWIHTFVPGLPLSLLDHNLVCGNALVGIGRMSEVTDIAAESGHEKKGQDKQLVLGNFDDPNELLGEATELLLLAGKIADTTKADVDKVREALKKAEAKLVHTAALCDIATACRITGEPFPFSDYDWHKHKDDIAGRAEHAKAERALEHLPPFHFPIAFPEVFLRERAGFDVLLGNPPWEEATLEEHAFWARHQPGLRSMKPKQFNPIREQLRADRKDLVALYEKELAQADTMRAALVNGGYPGMGTGDPDLYKAFCWRFWKLIAPNGGRSGTVLPRGALAAKGSAEFRTEVFAHAQDVSVTVLVNRAFWAFEGMDNRKTLGLVVLTSGSPQGDTIGLRGPFDTRARFDAGHRNELTRFSPADVTSWTDSASLPLLPTEQSLPVFAQLRRHPRLDLDDGKQWRARPCAELHATNDSEWMDLEAESCPKSYWPVYKGESFDFWRPDTSSYYAYANPKPLVEHLNQKRQRAGRSSKSPFSEFPEKWLKDAKMEPCNWPRIAFRDVTNRANQRTVITSLVPPKVFLTNKAPYLLFPRGDATDVAYLLGVLSSIPLDWYARRFVEMSLNFYILNPFPVPRPARDSALRLRVVQLAGRLAAVDARFADWAAQVGVACGPLEPEVKDDHIRELDAVVAHLYGLSEPQLRHVFETFHEGWDFAQRLAATVSHFRKWQGSV